MADPFTILGTTSSIITLLEFSWKLLAETRTIYKSATDENEDNAFLSAIADDATRLGDAITVSPGCGDDLQALVTNAQGVARDLLEVLDKLKVHGTKTVWKSFLVALKDVWRNGQIEAFSHRLAKLQAQIGSHIQLLILNGISEISHQLKNTNKVLGTTIQTEFRSLREDVLDAAARLDPEDSSNTTSVKKQLKVHENTETLDGRFVSAGKSTRNAQRVLMSLYFTGIRARRRKIPDAHAQTFTWIFQKCLPDSDPRTKFVNWLQSADGIFWIQGKPGSGKSTLMKFLSDHDDVRLHLKSWTGENELVIASFFFWHAGSPLQKSQNGLLRSLLFELLRHDPDLVPRVYALRVELDIDWDDDWTWTNEELLHVCRRIIAECSDVRFCFFIDGLDEYEEDQMDPTDLVKSIQSLASLSNIRLCVSSRPWSVFADVFGKNMHLSLQLEDLTRVFLWVYLVVRDLLNGFTSGDSLKLVMIRLERYPDDLEEFFQHMIDIIPSMYLQSTTRMFEIAKLASEPQSAVAFSFGDEIEAESKFATQLPVEPMSEFDLEMREGKMRRQLDARSKGLLEIASDGEKQHRYFQVRVDFLHRTVREFLLRPHGLSPFLHQHLGNLNTASIMCSAILATLKQSPTQRFGHQSAMQKLFERLFDWAVQVEQNAETPTELVRILGSAESIYNMFMSRSESTWETEDTSFLGLACERQIVSYVQARFSNSQLCTNIIKLGRPLLDVVVNGNLGNIHLGLVKILLDSGAEPNQTYGSSTVWTRFISSIAGEKDSGNHKNVKDVMELLVSYGANLESLSDAPSYDEPLLNLRLDDEPVSALPFRDNDDDDQMPKPLRRRPTTKSNHYFPPKRQNCLYGEGAWIAYGPKTKKIPSSEVVKAWFTEDEYAALLRKPKSAKSGGFKSIRQFRNLLPVKREGGNA
ncbi:hypothetical protein B0T10DRAFT_582146 [Thelonectria olida]|uniref:NACHT domain-containing protein n=1 Tax=Thelonectria olida TaxID=1576542 RepID=A0A9P8VWG0_9HYPO|nr:hypothetical protein B0T10DRAFT_582146 [Thelonectria olida]